MTQRILAVDDEPHMLLLLERIIREKTPYPITTTNNPLEVPAILSKETFDLIITDLKMPGLDGLEILRLVREKQRLEEVVIITAFGSAETSGDAMARGVFDYIHKPFRKEQIILTVERAMRWQQMRRELLALGATFEVEPYESAAEGFRREYLRRLAARCGGDVAAAARRAGVAEDVVRAAMG